MFDELQAVLERGAHAIRAFTTCFAELQLAYKPPTAECGGLFVAVLFICTSDKHVVTPCCGTRWLCCGCTRMSAHAAVSHE